MNFHLSKQWLIDMVERVAGTFVAAFLGALVISTGHVSIAAVQAAAIAGLASAVTVIKAIIGSQIGDPNSASVLPTGGGWNKPPVLPTGGGWNQPIAPAETHDAVAPSPPVAATPPVTEGSQ